MAVPVTQTRWFSELEGESTPFERVSSDEVEGRVLTVYRAQGSASAELAERVMRIFLSAHPELCPCFSIDRIHEEIANCPRIVINGRAICISENGYVPPSLRDRLSEGPTEHPVRCSMGHIFDLSRIHFWIERNGDHCPISPDHPIGTLQVDEGLAYKICLHHGNGRKRTREEAESHCQAERLSETLGQRQQVLTAEIETSRTSMAQAWVAIEREQRGQQIQLDYMTPPQPKVRLVSDLTKIVAKTTVYLGSKAVKKIAARVATTAAGQLVKQASRVAMFGIPFIGVLFGLGAGIYRFSHGEWILGAGEVLSGAASCLSLVPGVGTGLAMGAVILIDAAITACDTFELLSSNGDRRAIYANIGASYRVLGLDPNQNPTKEQVDTAYRTQIRLIHPDHAERELGATLCGSFVEYMCAISEAKKLVYQHNHWE